jgi:hypothetical protein
MAFDNLFPHDSLYLNNHTSYCRDYIFRFIDCQISAQVSDVPATLQSVAQLAQQYFRLASTSLR